MKNKLLLTIFLMFLFVLPAFAGGTNENLLIDLGGGVTFEMVKIPAGTFQMGSPDGELDRLDGETLHNVTLTKSFWMGKYEVTQGQWTKIMGSNPSKFISGDNYPVECVSWDDICQTGGYLEKINTLKPGGYSGFRLPTEAEWEFSCRANTTTAFYWGASANGDYLWYGDNSGSTTHPVGSAPGAAKGINVANAFGLYDMSGNVMEWCNDYDGSYDGQALTDPSGPATGSHHRVRGGGWGANAYNCRSANRGLNKPSCRLNGLGFRLALSSDQ